MAAKCIKLEANTHMSAQTHTGNVLLTLDPEINGSTELTMEHRYVKFSDPGCINF